MFRPIKMLIVGLVVVGGLRITGPASAQGPYSEIVVFGDSARTS